MGVGFCQTIIELFEIRYLGGMRVSSLTNVKLIYPATVADKWVLHGIKPPRRLMKRITARKVPLPEHATRAQEVNKLHLFEKLSVQD